MNTLPATLKNRVTCVKAQELICLRLDHCHPHPTIEVLTFYLDNKPVWIENADEELYHVKIGNDTALFLTAERVMQLVCTQRLSGIVDLR